MAEIVLYQIGDYITGVGFPEYWNNDPMYCHCIGWPCKGCKPHPDYERRACSCDVKQKKKEGRHIINLKMGWNVNSHPRALCKFCDEWWSGYDPHAAPEPLALEDVPEGHGWTEQEVLNMVENAKSKEEAIEEENAMLRSENEVMRSEIEKLRAEVQISLRGLCELKERVQALESKDADA